MISLCNRNKKFLCLSCRISVSVDCSVHCCHSWSAPATQTFFPLHLSVFSLVTVIHTQNYYPQMFAYLDRIHNRWDIFAALFGTNRRIHKNPGPLQVYTVSKWKNTCQSGFARILQRRQTRFNTASSLYQGLASQRLALYLS